MEPDSSIMTGIVEGRLHGSGDSGGSGHAWKGPAELTTAATKRSYGAVITSAVADGRDGRSREASDDAPRRNHAAKHECTCTGEGF